MKKMGEKKSFRVIRTRSSPSLVPVPSGPVRVLVTALKEGARSLWFHINKSALLRTTLMHTRIGRSRALWYYLACPQKCGACDQMQTSSPLYARTPIKYQIGQKLWCTLLEHDLVNHPSLCKFTFCSNNQFLYHLTWRCHLAWQGWI